jgi:hypothetical protein
LNTFKWIGSDEIKMKFINFIELRNFRKVVYINKISNTYFW